MGTTDKFEIKGPRFVERRHRRIRKSTFVRVALALAVMIIGVMVAMAWHWKSLSNSKHISDTIAWRIELFARKALGGVPELSWSELWQMTHHPGGFGLESFTRGVDSLNHSISDPYETDADHQAAARIFSARCAMCHGQGGGGGAGPPLNQPGLKHGDTDLAIYRVLRDGVPNTLMRAPSISMVERWQLVGYVRELQLHVSGLGLGKTPPDIEVSNEQLLEASSKTDEWLTYSGSLDGHHYTPLTQINPGNVSRLRIRWVRQFDTNLPTIESTPIVAGGVIFTTEPPSDVIAVDALDAKSGDLIWRYTRKISAAARSCCGRVNRGLAVLDKNVYLGSFEGNLVCINADSGDEVWETQVADPSKGYAVTMAPLIVNRSVIVGVAGGEYGIRGFLAAYDVETGKKEWQFDTVPGSGEAGHETWSGDSWRTGGGSTWVTGSYDPSLDLIYWGIGNPSPDFSGDDRAGDNLYSESVVALNGTTGQLAWHFQFTPHDVHDWDSAQTPILADISINGKPRKVICWANRNGFYYVLDRVTGEFLLGVPYMDQNWAKGLDSTGRPIPVPEDNSSDTEKLVKPADEGGTNFQNGAFDAQRELIFVPATQTATVFSKALHVTYNAGEFFEGSSGHYLGTPIPFVRAIDVATGKEKWEYSSPSGQHFSMGNNWYSGLLATGGGLVFGASGGSVFALDSATGQEVWRAFLGGDTRAAPISFTVDGRQVVAVSAGRALFLFGL